MEQGKNKLPMSTPGALEAQRPAKPAALSSLRYLVVMMALVSPFVVTYSRTIINFALIDMIEPQQSTSSSEQTTGGESTDAQTQVTTTNPLLQPAERAYFDLDNSCPVDENERARLLEENQHGRERARTTQGEKFAWDTFQQGLLKAAYPIGHAPFQIPGGRMAEIYGSHLVISLSALTIAVLCLLAPYLAGLHFYLLFADLALLGVLGSFMTPALITLFSNWLTPGEKSFCISLYMLASRLGYALSALICGLLFQAEVSWRYVFHSAGYIGAAFGGAFLLLARSRPRDHPLISQEELKYLAFKSRLVRESLAQEEEEPNGYELKEQSNSAEINSCPGAQQQQQQQQPEAKSTRPSGAPWLAIITNVPVIAFVLTKFCVKLAGDTVQIELPTYLSRVMHFSPQANGFVNASNYVIFCLGCTLVGAFAKFIVKRRPFGLSKTSIRKLFQCTASFGVSLGLIGIAFSVCNNIATQACLMFIFAVTTFGVGGEAQMPVDLTERYSGTIHAIGSSLAISGVIEPPLVGFLLRGHAADRDSWYTVWLGASGIAFTGGLVFLLLGDANLQPFDKIHDERNSSNEQRSEEQSDRQVAHAPPELPTSPPRLSPAGNHNKAFQNDQGQQLDAP